MTCRGLLSSCAFLQRGSAVPPLYYFNIIIKRLDIKYIEMLDKILNDLLALEYDCLNKIVSSKL